MPSVLVVEDNELVLKSIEYFLHKEGFDMASAKNGKEAIEFLDRIHCDVVVTDIIMPYVDGFQLVKKIKSDPSRDHIGIIIVSSINKEISINESLAVGADEYLMKPFMPYDLVLRIKKLITLKQGQAKTDNL